MPNENKEKWKHLQIEIPSRMEYNRSVNDTNQVFEEVKNYSITPTTFKSRIYCNDDSDVDYALLMHKVFDCFDPNNKAYTLPSSTRLSGGEQNLPSYFVDYYSFQKENTTVSNVLRFGFVPQKDDVKINQELNVLVDTGKPQGTKPNKDEKQIRHCEIEKLVFKHAMDFLLTSDSIVAIIDIYARHDKDDKKINSLKNQLKIDENSIPEIHTVVLYKNQREKYEKQVFTVIDPSNSDFSKHLSNNDMFEVMGSIFEKNMELEIKNNFPNHDFMKERLAHSIAVDGIKIQHSTQENTSKIYSVPEKKSTGPSVNQYRDCIDISIKIAFAISHDNSENPNVFLHKLKMLSNNQTFIKIESCLELENGYSVKGRQSSDMEKNYKVYQREKAFCKYKNDAKKQLEGITKAIVSLTKFCKDDDKNILEKFNTIKTRIEDQNKPCSIFENKYKAFLEQSAQEDTNIKVDEMYYNFFTSTILECFTEGGVDENIADRMLSGPLELDWYEVF